jgi:hypothetical protein
VRESHSTLAPGHLCENRHGEWLEYAESLPHSQKFPRGVTFGGEAGGLYELRMPCDPELASACFPTLAPVFA